MRQARLRLVTTKNAPKSPFRHAFKQKKILPPFAFAIKFESFKIDMNK